MTKHNTAIEWTHIPGYRGETWNPVVGCSIASKGCTNCYAMRFANNRLDGNPKTPHYAGTTEKVNGNPVWTGKVSLASEKTLFKPLSWSKPRSIFVNSMGDLFHEDVPDEWIDQVLAAMLCAQSANHIFIILTKRAQRMHDYFNELKTSGRWLMFEHPKWGGYIFDAAIAQYKAMTSRIWLGVSTEDQATANERIPYLLNTPAAVRFVSCEPLLGEINLEPWLAWPVPSVETNLESWGCECCDVPCDCPNDKAVYICDEGPRDEYGCPEWMHCERQVLDWVIAGGESGPNSRPMHPDWARSLRDQCQAANVPFFFKQWGEWVSVYDRDIDDPDWRNTPKAKNNKERYINLEGGHGFHGERVCFIKKTGKKKSGHLLDGVEHFNWPECVKVLEGDEV